MTPFSKTYTLYRMNYDLKDVIGAYEVLGSGSHGTVYHTRDGAAKGAKLTSKKIDSDPNIATSPSLGKVRVDYGEGNRIIIGDARIPYELEDESEQNLLNAFVSELEILRQLREYAISTGDKLEKIGLPTLSKDNYYECRVIDGHLHLVLNMDYIPGKPVDKLIKEGINEGDAYRIMFELSETVNYIRQRGVLHRDIKPANIMSAERKASVAEFTRRQTTLIDLSVARMDVPLVETPFDRSQYLLKKTKSEIGKIIGTPEWMSPEHVKGANKVISASDIFSTGMLFAYISMGKMPEGVKNDTYQQLLWLNNYDKNDQNKIVEEMADNKVDRTLAVKIGEALDPSPNKRSLEGTISRAKELFEKGGFNRRIVSETDPNADTLVDDTSIYDCQKTIVVSLPS
jgi:serine/threonine protein kinase